MGNQFTRRTLLTAAPVLALAFLPKSPALSLPQLAADDSDTFFQSLRRLDSEGRARVVEFLRGQDHPIFKALAAPVERYCAQLNAADQFRGNVESVM